jgi:hypothetical protein
MCLLFQKDLMVLLVLWVLILLKPHRLGQLVLRFPMVLLVLVHLMVRLRRMGQ